MIKMTQAQLNSLIPLDEDIELHIRKQCQIEIDEVICLLYGYVQVADMPDATRTQLLNELAHISAHIKQELKELLAEIEGRTN